MLKNLKTLLLTVLIVGISVMTAFSFYGLSYRWVQVVDEQGVPIASGLTFEVQAIDSGSAATIYSDDNATSKTNSTTVPSSGVVGFYYTPTTYDLQIGDGVDTYLFEDLTATDHTVVFTKVIDNETSINIDGGSIDGTPIGATTVSTGAFSTLTSTGALTANGGIVVGTVATGLDFTGTYTGNVLDFSNATHVPTGSNGPCLIRAGTYAAPITNTSEDQSGLIRLYMSTTADGTSYDRGVFVALKTAGAKGIFPISGLAEVLTDATGPTKAQAAQFIVGLHEAGSNLATAGGDATAGMYGAWLKVYSVTGSVAASGSKVAPVWVDNQMSGTVSGEEYGIFATTGGTRPDGFIGFETSSSGYDQFIYADTTFNSGAGTCIETDDITGETTQDARIKVWYDGAQYYIPLYR